MAPSAEPSSSSTSRREYEVFLSFRGEDTRNNFISSLYTALHNSGVGTFLDKEEVDIGEKIGDDTLLTAIEQSRISIIVFSNDYASSKWCLEELVNIRQCRESNRQIVMPIFIDVRNQTGSFEKAFLPKARKEFEVKVEESIKRSRGTKGMGLFTGCCYFVQSIV